MNKSKQVHAVQPDVIPGQITAEEVLEQQNITSGTNSTINAKKRCQTSTSGTGAVTPSSATQTGAGDTSKGRKSSSRKSGAKDASKSKIVPIDSKRKSKSGAEVSLVDQPGAKQVRKQGQRGPDKQVRKRRCDHDINLQVPPDEKQIIVRYNVELWNLDKLQNPNDEEEVRERIRAYFSISDKYQQVPTVAGLALALGIDRRTLWTWMEQKSGTIKNPAVLDTIKTVYNLITSQYEGLLTQGKITPVSGFFLMQNNFGYKNTTDHVVSVQQQEEPDTSEIASRAGLLEDGSGADDR